MTMRVLYDYFRSSAAYRVRIALHLKNLPYESIPITLLENVQRSDAYLARNPQGLVPTLVDGELTLTQSLAICEYLDEVHPSPAFLPSASAARAAVRALALSVACDIHPLNNLRVLRYLKNELAVSEEQSGAWYRHWISEGFSALERQLQATHGVYAYGDVVSLADICLVPQVYNARRFGCDLTHYPTIMAIERQCLTLAAFSETAPEQVK
jgi:maleylacetoacetate isomerase